MMLLPETMAQTMRHAQHAADGCVSDVWYSRCDLYRYGLSRCWDAKAQTILFIMLNPSTADEMRNDPTIARCEKRARLMGFGTMLIANLFAFRATDPKLLKQAKDPVGPCNDPVLDHWINVADQVIAAWGVHGAYLDAGPALMQRLEGTVTHLGLTKDGHPRHPLYVPMSVTPTVRTSTDQTTVS